jgi:hypothetical protein
VLNKSKYILHLRFFKVAKLCLDDSFAHSWHSLNQLHLECFSNRLEGVPTYAEHLLAAFPSFCGPTHPKPDDLFTYSASNKGTAVGTTNLKFGLILDVAILTEYNPI